MTKPKPALGPIMDYDTCHMRTCTNDATMTVPVNDPMTGQVVDLDVCDGHAEAITAVASTRRAIAGSRP